AMSDPDRVNLAFIWDTTSPHFSRRTFMRTMAFASAAGFAAACASSAKTGTGSSASTTSPTFSSKPEAKVLNFYNWTDYIAKDTIPNFQKNTGIKVTYDNYSSNDDLLAKIRTGGTGFDIIVPTDATLVKMKHASLLQPLDLSLIPNIVNLDPRFRTAEYDPGNQYSIPWQWGTTGIGYDKTKVTGTVTDWDALKLPSAKGKSSFLKEARDAFAMALFALKKDPNTLNDADLDAAQQYLIDLKKNVKSITSDYQDPLKSGELILCQAYSGDVFSAQTDNKNLEYVIPTSGALSWVDSMAMPKGAPHPKNAEAFMNYILEPKVGAALTNVVNYGSPNKAAQPFINKDILDNPLIYPPADVLAKLPFQKDLGEDEIKYSDRWDKVLTA
ncbi:MAG TPA: spermidine/putrescine ABC transporter substrate-binding protein, partial [Acidimicrobiia bacterium]|nr:spermidine/putrescine ABC transporter substrate-binding protein [Acidimicrobiia bacterium]